MVPILWFLGKAMAHYALSPSAGPDYPRAKPLDSPVFMEGEVVKGFGRGSKVLGIPTANLPQHSLHQLPGDFSTGIYFGWATVNGQGPYAMVTSVGWNPYFSNKVKTVEPHLLHEFPEDFYGAQIRLVITGYLRDELNFDSLDALIAAIQADIQMTKKCLQEDYHLKHRDNPYLQTKASVPLIGVVAAVGLFASVGIVLYMRTRGR
mmetsp:Transcript_10956/g.17222  ORF Transcript_10956/g.17222 Transcript_10956/m.17222 type:complete len:206 (+) Transcript_10956:1-618(+)